MPWQVKHTDRFTDWCVTLRESQQDFLAAQVGLQMDFRSTLPYPFFRDIQVDEQPHDGAEETEWR